MSAFNSQGLKTKIGETLSSLELLKSNPPRRKIVNNIKETVYDIATELLNSHYKKIFPEKWIEPLSFKRQNSRSKKPKEEMLIVEEQSDCVKNTNEEASEKYLF